MKVFVNDQEVNTYRGAKVLSAIRKFDKSLLAKIKAGTVDVRDRYGNYVAISGAISDGAKLYVNPIKK